MTAQRLSDIQTQRRRNVKRLLSWEANEAILKDFYRGLNPKERSRMLSPKDLAILHKKDITAIERILQVNVSTDYLRDREIYYIFTHKFPSAELYTQEDIGKQYTNKNGKHLGRARVGQIIAEIAEDMERLGILDLGEEAQS